MHHKLKPILEESCEEFDDDFDPYDRAQDGFVTPKTEATELVAWDETTLITAMLEDESSSDMDHQTIIAKANALRTPMNALSRETKAEIVKTLVPAVQRLQETHATLGSQIDPAFGRGLLDFDELCQKFERATRRSRAELVPVLEALPAARADSVARLRDAYARLAQLRMDFEAAIDAIADRAIEDLKAFPTKFDVMIVQWEKKVRDFEKDQGSSAKAKENERLLKQLLGNM